MSRIKGFSDYVNEDYSLKNVLKKGKSFLSGASDWVSDLFKKISSGEIKAIPEGPKAGAPMVSYYEASPESSIADQVKKTFTDTAEESVDDSINLQDLKIEEDLEHLKFPTTDVVNINAKDLKAEIKDRFEDFVEGGFNKPIFIFGAPGIGKTEMVAQVCDELGINLMTVDLQFMDPADFLGVPKVIDLPDSEEKYGSGVTRTNPPVWLPTDNGKDDKGGIIFFDELNRAADPVITGMMNLAQGRRVNTYKLPPKWFIVAAGNRPSDDAPEKVKDLGTALADRFSVYNYVSSTKDWIDWVQTSQKKMSGAYESTPSEVVLPELINFLEFSEEYFHNLDPNNPDVKFATPRGWVDASKSLYSKLRRMRKEGKESITGNELKRIFQVEVGERAANAFVTFYELVQSIPLQDVLKVFDEPEKAPLPKKEGGAYRPDLTFATLAAIVSRADKLNPDGKITADQFGNAIDYCIRLDQAEYATSFVSMLISKHPYITQGGRPYQMHLMKYTQHYLDPLKK